MEKNRTVPTLQQKESYSRTNIGASSQIPRTPKFLRWLKSPFNVQARPSGFTMANTNHYKFVKIFISHLNERGSLTICDWKGSSLTPYVRALPKIMHSSVCTPTDTDGGRTRVHTAKLKSQSLNRCHPSRTGGQFNRYKPRGQCVSQDLDGDILGCDCEARELHTCAGSYVFCSAFNMKFESVPKEERTSERVKMIVCSSFFKDSIKFHGRPNK
jgi:hypothetical protein